MSHVRAFRALSLLATVGVLVVTACTIQLRGGNQSPPLTKAEQRTDATTSDLANCRSVTTEETAEYQHCRQVWAENRRRFLGKKDAAAVSPNGDSAEGLAPATKDQSRIPRGHPNLAAPEASKP